jgi:hypothetical protein
MSLGLMIVRGLLYKKRVLIDEEEGQWQVIKGAYEGENVSSPLT